MDIPPSLIELSDIGEIHRKYKYMCEIIKFKYILCNRMSV